MSGPIGDLHHSPPSSPSLGGGGLGGTGIAGSSGSPDGPLLRAPRLGVRFGSVTIGAVGPDAGEAGSPPPLAMGSHTGGMKVVDTRAARGSLSDYSAGYVPPIAPPHSSASNDIPPGGLSGLDFKLDLDDDSRYSQDQGFRLTTPDYNKK